MTNIYRHWLFGEKVNDQEQRQKGWFPRRCAVELTENPSTARRRNKKNL